MSKGKVIGAALVAISVGIGLFYAHSHQRAVPTATSHIWRLSQRADGALCVVALADACVWPNGLAYIPAGEARTTLAAYMLLRREINPRDEFAMRSPPESVKTRAARGLIQEIDTLDAMLDGSGLTRSVQESEGGVSIVIRWASK